MAGERIVNEWRSKTVNLYIVSNQKKRHKNNS